MKDVVILGSGRSGTSMIGKLFHEAEYYMGPDLLPGTAGNPMGLFESSAINFLNEDLYAEAVKVRPRNLIGKVLLWPRLASGQLWLTTLPLDSEIREPTASHRARIEEWTSHRPFAFKDPRFCYTLSAWRPWLGEECTFVCIFREPDRTADSILRECREERYLRNLRMTPHRALEIWRSMYEWVLRVQASTGNWTFLHFDQVLAGPGVDRLESVAEVRLDRSFIQPRLSRARRLGHLPSGVEELYAELCARAGFEA